jgi:CheY-like chemotaxis protein
MGGLEATRKIQEFNGVISVVALTANVFVQGKQAFMQTFADKSS